MVSFDTSKGIQDRSYVSFSKKNINHGNDCENVAAKVTPQADIQHSLGDLLT
jgi:hypothetical protein